MYEGGVGGEGSDKDHIKSNGTGQNWLWNGCWMYELQKWIRKNKNKNQRPNNQSTFRCFAYLLNVGFGVHFCFWRSDRNIEAPLW